MFAVDWELVTPYPLDDDSVPDELDTDLGEEVTVVVLPVTSCQ